MYSRCSRAEVCYNLTYLHQVDYVTTSLYLLRLPHLKMLSKKIYGLPALDSKNGFTNAQGTLLSPDVRYLSLTSSYY